MTKERFDIHQHITDQIIAALERGVAEFKLPWHRAAGNVIRPTNVASKKPYRGVNILTLWASADARGFETGLWGTYRQWAEAGAQVRKGEKAAYIVFYKEFLVAGEDDEDTEKRLFARATPVFSAEQVEGYALPSVDTTPNVVEPIVHAEAFVAQTGAQIVHGGSRAFYRPATDHIQMPPREAFIGTTTSTPVESYYATLLHELTHWTGAEARCNRQLGKRFGDQAYAMEELVAELGAAYLCADLALTAVTREDHAAYIGSWLAVLKSDKRAIFTAAAQAQRACDFLTAFGEAPDAALQLA
jgi:antirestriction protein ArdC